MIGGQGYSMVDKVTWSHVTTVAYQHFIFNTITVMWVMFDRNSEKVCLQTQSYNYTILSQQSDIHDYKY